MIISPLPQEAVSSSGNEAILRHKELQKKKTISYMLQGHRHNSNAEIKKFKQHLKKQMTWWHFRHVKGVKIKAEQHDTHCSPRGSALSWHCSDAASAFTRDNEASPPADWGCSFAHVCAVLEQDGFVCRFVHNVLRETAQKFGVLSLVHRPQDRGRSPPSRIHC